MDMGDDRASNWVNHFLPGVALLIWAAHWNHGVFKAWLKQSNQHPYVSRNTYPTPFMPSTWPIEPLFKCLLPPLAIFAQLWWSSGSWK